MFGNPQVTPEGVTVKGFVLKMFIELRRNINGEVY